MMVEIKRTLLVLGLILLLAGATGPTQAQGPEEGWQVYTNATIVRDLALKGGGALGGGYTWVAMWGGVVCYSASELVKFTTLDGLADNDARAITVDSEGLWWFGADYGGVSVLDDAGTPLSKGDDTWTVFTTVDGLASDHISAITQDSRGQLWFGTWDGVSVLDDGGTPFGKGDDTWITFTTTDGLAHNYVSVIAVDDAGRLWFGTWGGGVSVLDYGGTPFVKGDDTWITFTTTDGLADNQVSAIAADGAGRMWLGTGGGASVLDHGGTPFEKRDDIWNTFTTADSLVDNDVRAIAVDSGERLWFGTYDSGVSMLDYGGVPFGKGDDTWATFTTTDGLAHKYVGAITEDGAGRLWFGTSAGASVLDHGGTPFEEGDDIWTTFTTASGLAHNDVQAITEDGEARLWFGTDGGGASVLDDGGTPFDQGDDTWTAFTTADILPAYSVCDIVVDDAGRLWFGTWGGVLVLDDGGTPFGKGDDTWNIFTESDGLAGNGVRVIAVDDAGRLWFGTWGGGVSVLDYGGTPFVKGDDTWITFTTTDGLAHNHVRAIAADGAGRMWFGTIGGASVLDHGGTPFEKGDDIWNTFTESGGLAGNNVSAILVDSMRRLWFGTGWDGGGASVLDDGGTPFDKEDDTWATFTTTDGLAHNHVGAIAADGAGRLWFGTSAGASVLDHGGTPFDKEDDIWTTFGADDGLAGNAVQAIFVDSKGWRWFGTYDDGVGELMDAVAPASSASSPVFIVDGAIPVSWSATDGASHVFGTSLWVKYVGGGTWTDTGLSQRGQSAGTFHYIPTQGDGTYYFATVAEDWMGNSESPPSGYGDTSTVYGGSDSYEPDDTCAQASPVPTDGTVQVHTFHDYADADWTSFDATSGTTYLVEVQVPSGSPADVSLDVYDRCGGDPQDSQDHTFSPGVRMAFQATADGPLYLKLLDHDPAVYGPDVTYHLSVRTLDDAPTPGAVVIVAGKLRDGDHLQPNIHHVTNAVYRLFQAHGYGGSRIQYLATDVTLDPDNDGAPDVDGLPTRANLGQAVTGWAADKVGPDRAFTLYLMDHGEYDTLYLNGSTEVVSPDDIDGWLDALEAAVPGVRVNVIVEACHSGSFIDSASTDELIQTVSGPGRLVVTSTGAWNLAYASDDGAAFSDPFVQALQSGMSLYGSFQEARWAVEVAHPDQTPWLDDDGDGVPNEGEDGQEGAQRGFAYAGTFGESWPPYVASAGVGEIQAATGVITAEARDDGNVSRVWALIYPPSYRPPTSGEELVQEAVPAVTLSYVGNGIYSSEYDGFTEAGPYRVVVYAVDEEGLAGRPKAAGAQHRTYLPLVVNNYASRVTHPVHVGDAIPVRAVGRQGEVFYTTPVRMPEAVPPGGRFYFSFQRDAVAEVLVDDEVAVLLDGEEVFNYRFSSNSRAPEPAIVEVPRATMEGLVGRTVTVEYRDVYGDVVEASAVWLVWTP